MSSRMAYTNPERLARAAFRMVTKRIAQGYWPKARAITIIHPPIVEISIQNEAPKRKSDKQKYVFEFQAVDKDTALAAARRLHDLFFEATYKVG